MNDMVLSANYWSFYDIGKLFIQIQEKCSNSKTWICNKVGMKSITRESHTYKAVNFFPSWWDGSLDSCVNYLSLF